MAIQPKILFVDDEEAILSAAKRLLRGKNIEVLTAQSPKAALNLLSNEDCWVVVSDYRMPEMTGTELLEEVKRRSPQVSRIMLTGFLERPIIEEAINRASVFRFITKPWDDTELLLGLERAIQHSGRHRTNAQLIHEITAQNIRLEQFTQNLESEVVGRTKGIEESRSMAESKQRLVRELSAFIKDLSRVSDVPQLYEVIHHEMMKFGGISLPYLFLFHGRDRGELFWIESKTLHEKILTRIPAHLNSLSVRTSSTQDRDWWGTIHKKQISGLMAVPIRARETGNPEPVAILFIEHKMDRIVEFLDRVTERLQPVSIVLDKILLREQLVEAAKQWEVTFDGFKDPIAIVDNQERVTRANKSFFKAGRQRCHEMFNESDQLCEGCPMPETFASQQAQSGVVRDLQSRTFRIHSYPIGISRVVNHYSDVSHERNLYMRLVQSEKLAAVGLLAGSIAHELNNPLSGILSFAQILQSQMEVTNPLLTDLMEVEKAAVRCQLIIRNLLNFSEPMKDQADLSDINDLIDSTLPLLKTALRSQNLHKHYAEDLPKLRVQPSQIQQVFFNLINNACQAMATGGQLTIRTWASNSQVCVSISDTGPGISPEIKARIFEPFFTTKSVGIGTGLGLSVSKSIVERLGGTIELSSQPGVGSTFTVSLPSGESKGHESSYRR